MIINIIAVGKIKDKSLQLTLDEYVKRISKYADLTQTTVKESLLPPNPTPGEIINALDNEAKDILSKISDKEYVIVLDVNGMMISSEQFAVMLEAGIVRGQSKVSFIIGSSHGLAETIKARANYSLSFSKLTFPHQLFRVLLLEQIFRSFKILNNESYHK